MSFFLVLLTLVLPAYAQLQDGQGHSWPESIDLRDQFRPYTKQQIGGTCHVYAAAALVEAACFRKLGKYIDLSRSYLIERHLLQSLIKNGPDCVNPDPGVYIVGSNIDGGLGSHTFDRIIGSRSVCTEEEFPTTLKPFLQIQKALENYGRTADSLALDAAHTEFEKKKSQLNAKEAALKISLALNQGKSGPHSPLRAIQKPIVDHDTNLRNEIIRKAELQNGIREKKLFDQQREILKLDELKTFESKRNKYLAELKQSTYQKLIDILQSDLKSRLQNPVKGNKEYDSHTVDQNLNSCLNQLKVNHASQGEYSHPTDVLTLLSHGYPVVCAGEFDLGGGAKGGHETVIIGYRFNAAFDNKIEFLIRDSNRLTPSWGWSIQSCRDLYWIQ